MVWSSCFNLIFIYQILYLTVSPALASQTNLVAIPDLKLQFENFLGDFAITNPSSKINDVFSKLEKHQYSSSNNVSSNLDWFLGLNKNNIETKSQEVCLVVSSFEGFFINSGIGTAYTALAQFLVEKGHKVTVLYTSDTPTATKNYNYWIEYYKEKNINVETLASSNLRLTVSRLVRKSYEVYTYLKSKNFDVVHFSDFEGHGYYSELAKIEGLHFQNTQFVVGLHGPWRWVLSGMGQELKSVEDFETDFIERKSVEMADSIWTPSVYLVKWLEDQNWKINGDVYVLPYLLGNDLEKIKNSPNLLPSAKTNQTNELVFFGRLETRKGLELFCNAIDILSDQNALKSQLEKTVITFMGAESNLLLDGLTSSNYITKRSKNWPSQIKIITSFDRKTSLEYLLGEGRVAIIPSIVDNSPYTVFECLNLGIPFIATSLDSIKSLVEPGDRQTVLVEPKANLLMRKIATTLKRGSVVVPPIFSPQEITSTWTEFYDSITSKKTNKHQDLLETLPLVSVCLIHYNRPYLLNQSIDSILQQDYPNIEVILVDDGSTTSDALSYIYSLETMFAEKNWKIIRSENKYLGAARNTAASHATGSYLFFLDDDNYAFPNSLSTYVSVSQKVNASVLTSPHILAKGLNLPQIEPGVLTTSMWIPLGNSLSVGVYKNCFGDSNFFISKKDFIESGGFSEDVGVGQEDHEFLLKMAIKKYNIEVIPEPLLYYRMHDNQKQMIFTTDRRSNQVRSARSLSEVVEYDEIFHVWAERDANAAKRQVAAGSCNSSTEFEVKRSTPQTGPAEGGTPIVIRGVLDSACPVSTDTVTVGGTECRSVYFQSDTELVCVSPGGIPSINLDIVVVILGRTFTLSEAFSYVARRPTILNATISPDGGSFTIFFDIPTNRGGYGNEEIPAENLISQSNRMGEDSVCVFSNSQSLVCYFGSEEPDDPDGYLQVGDLVQIEIQTISNSGYSSTGSYVSTDAVNLTVGDTVPPQIQLSYPRTVGDCSDVLLDATYSTGTGGRQFSAVTWAGPDSLSTFIDSANSNSALSINVPSTSITTNGVYNFTLTLENWLSRDSSSSSFSFTKVSVESGLTDISGPSSLIYLRSNQVFLYGTAFIPNCQSQSLVRAIDVNYSWTITYQDTNTALRFANTDVEFAPELKPVVYNFKNIWIPSNYFPLGNFRITLETTSRSSALSGPVVSSASVDLTVERAELVAIISGGSVTRSTAHTVVLNAASSGFIGEPSSNLQFTWSCTPAFNQNITCTSSGFSQSDGLLTILPGELALGIWNFCVEVSEQGSTTIAPKSTCAVVTIIVEPEVPKLSLSYTTVDVPGGKFVVEAALDSETATVADLDFEWTLEGLAEKQENFNTVFEDGRLKSFVIVIKPNKMNPGTSYVFTVFGTLNNITGSASLTIDLGEKPYGGRLDIFLADTGAPLADNAVSTNTKLRLNVNGWQHTQKISSVMFRYKLFPITSEPNVTDLASDDGEVSLSERSLKTSLDVFLPEGKVVLLVYVQSRIGTYVRYALTNAITVNSVESNVPLVDQVDNLVGNFSKSVAESHSNNFLEDLALIMTNVAKAATQANEEGDTEAVEKIAQLSNDMLVQILEKTGEEPFTPEAADTTMQACIGIMETNPSSIDLTVSLKVWKNLFEQIQEGVEYPTHKDRGATGLSLLLTALSNLPTSRKRSVYKRSPVFSEKRSTLLGRNILQTDNSTDDIEFDFVSARKEFSGLKDDLMSSILGRLAEQEEPVIIESGSLSLGAQKLAKPIVSQNGLIVDNGGLSSSRFEIPATVFDQFFGDESVSSSFADYSENPYASEGTAQTDEKITTYGIVSYVASLELIQSKGVVPVEDIDGTPISIEVPIFSVDTPEDTLCVWWNNDVQFWSTEGCIVASVEDTFAVLRATHMTEFALAYEEVSVLGEASASEEPDDWLWLIITIILVLLALFIVVLLVARRRKDEEEEKEQVVVAGANEKAPAGGAAVVPVAAAKKSSSSSSSFEPIDNEAYVIGQRQAAAAASSSSSSSDLPPVVVSSRKIKESDPEPIDADLEFYFGDFQEEVQVTKKQRDRRKNADDAFLEDLQKRARPSKHAGEKRKGRKERNNVAKKYDKSNDLGEIYSDFDKAFEEVLDAKTDVVAKPEKENKKDVEPEEPMDEDEKEAALKIQRMWRGKLEKMDQDREDQIEQLLDEIEDILDDNALDPYEEDF